MNKFINAIYPSESIKEKKGVTENVRITNFEVLDEFNSDETNKSFIDDDIIKSNFMSDINYSKPDNSSIKVECAFCQKMIDIVELENHEIKCIEILSRSNDIQCSFCNVSIPFSTFGQHQYECNRKLNEMQINTYNKSILLSIQYNALKSVNDICKNGFINAKENIMKKLSINEFLYQRLIDNFNANNVIINFHPSKHLEFYMKDTNYRNLFETNTSSGSKSIHNRTTWEDNMFNNIYHNALPHERCKYGVLNITKDVYIGGASTYGDSYFIMTPDVKNRATMTYGDSSSYSTGYSFLYPETFLDGISNQFLEAMIYNDYIPINQGRGYVECQIHGDVLFNRDIFACVGHERHRNTDVGKNLKIFCEKNNIILTWRGDILS
jgi:hypothetical protein